MLVGPVPAESEIALFEFLSSIEADTVIDKSDSLGCYTGDGFDIQLINPHCKPVQHDIRKCSKRKQEFIDATVDKMLEWDVIETTFSDWQNGIVVANKPGPGDEFRFCLDVIDLNDRTVKIKYPMPVIDEIIQSLGHAKYFIKLDLAKGYWQIPVVEKARKYLTFVTRRGTYRFKRMPFGPTNAPGFFQAVMNTVLSKVLFRSCFVYLDDIIIFAESIPELLQQGKEVMELLSAYGLKLSGIKSEFVLTEVELLGRIIKNGCVYPKFDKLQGLLELRDPRDQSEVRSIYGLLSYFRQFVDKFSIRAKPITQLMKGDVKDIVWSDACKQAVREIVELIGTSCLLLPKFGEPFYLQTDFSFEGISAVLMQKVNKVMTPVMFASRSLIPAEANYAPIEGEALAILFAIKRFDYLLHGQRVIIRTDHRPLSFLKHGSEANRKLARWWAELQQYDYTIEYIAGKENIADCLSRLTTAKEQPAPDATLGACCTTLKVISEAGVRCAHCGEAGESDILRCDLCGASRHLQCWEDTAISKSLVFWYCDACSRKLLVSDPAMDASLLQYLKSGAVAGATASELSRLKALSKQYYIMSGRLYVTLEGHHCEVICPQDRLAVLKDIHDSSGHIGIKKLYESCRQHFYWPYLLEDCTRVVRWCQECQMEKGKQQYAPLKPTPKFDRPYMAWSIDLLPTLPISPEGYRHCLIMVDAFSKWIELVPLRSKSSQEVANALYNHIFSRFGLPYVIRSDRGREFRGEVEALCVKFRVKHVEISRAHPQANGQAERFVAVVKACLAKLLYQHHRDKGDWVNFLSSCLIGLRFFVHRVLGYSPFTICSGLSPNWPTLLNPRIGVQLEDLSSIELNSALVEILSNISQVHDENVLRLAVADDVNELTYNTKHPMSSGFYQGQLVLVKITQRYALDLHFAGPYRVVGYKSRTKNVLLLEDANGNIFSEAGDLVIPLMLPGSCCAMEKCLLCTVK